MRLSAILVVLALTTAGLTACAEKVDETKPPQLAVSASKPKCEKLSPASINLIASVRVVGKDRRTVGYNIVIVNSVTKEEASNKPGRRPLSGDQVNNEVIGFDGPSSVTIVSQFGQQLNVGAYSPEKICPKPAQTA